MAHSRSGALAVLVLLLAGCTGDSGDPDRPSAGGTPADEPVRTSSSTPPPAPDSFTLVATGDVLVHQEGALTGGALRPDGTYDFAEVFAPVAGLIGAAELVATRTPKHCLGVYAEVRQPGEIAVGDAVLL